MPDPHPPVEPPEVQTFVCLTCHASWHEWPGMPSPTVCFNCGAALLRPATEGEALARDLWRVEYGEDAPLQEIEAASRAAPPETP